MDQLPMFELVPVCAQCQHQFPTDFVPEWGRKYGVGVGPTPVCDQVLIDERTGSGHVCRGQVAALPIAIEPAGDLAGIDLEGDAPDDAVDVP